MFYRPIHNKTLTHTCSHRTYVELERVELKADQEPHEGSLVVNSCRMKSCVSVLLTSSLSLQNTKRRTYVALQKRVGAVLDKELGDLQVAFPTSPEESSLSTLLTAQSHSTTRASTYAVLIVDDRLVFADEPPHFGKVTVYDGQNEILSGHLDGTLRKADKKTES